MKNFILIIITAAVLIGGYLMWPKAGDYSASNPEKLAMVLHKSPTCGCCGVYGSYMKNEGYGVEISDVSDNSLSALKQELGIPKELWSCHTSEIGGYIVEGHIPNEAIKKLLEEKPDIKGIGMAGMPSGSPGMPGIKTDFMIYRINHDGSAGELFLKM